MSLSRWKMMAGVLALSLGGLAAMAGQCPKSEPAKGSAPPEIPVASVPAAAPLVFPPAPSLPPVPKPPEPSSTPNNPPAPIVIPASGTLPVPPQASSLPMVPAVDVPSVVQSATTPPSPPAGIVYDKPPRHTEESIPLPSTSANNPAASPMLLPSVPASLTPPSPKASVPEGVYAPDGGITSMEIKHAKVSETKYRILLRVGEGEPVFEVRCADTLMLKVVCEKVDVKSPEKGQGLSSVRACGQVRFAGFGAEGTCDELNFLAGTGEVAMTGHVRIQVKDKLGRVESELSSELMKYKIDPQAIAGTGVLKP